MAATLSERDGGALPLGGPPTLNGYGDPKCDFPGQTAACSDVYSANALYKLKPGSSYTLRLAVETTRGNRAIVSASSRAMQSALQTNSVEVEAANKRVWAKWCNASTVQLGKRSTLEAYW